jgi:hypothetical protein
VIEGLPPLAALQSATLNPAKMLNATDSLGTVAAGKLADLVLLDANPLADITHTTMIRAVVANGRYFDRAALDQLLAAVQPQVKPAPLLPPAPTPARAPAVPVAALVGTWVKSTGKDTLSIRADGTFRWGANTFNRWGLNGFPVIGRYKRWNYFRGDTLSLWKNGRCVGPNVPISSCLSLTNQSTCPGPEHRESARGECLRGVPGYLLALKDRQLTLTALEGTSRKWVQGTYTRVETPSPSVPAVRLADLVGTWRGKNKVTLSLRADSTFCFASGDGCTADSTYTRWNYLRGDTLAFQKNGACFDGTRFCRVVDGTIYRYPCWDGSTETWGPLTTGKCQKGEPGYQITLQDRQLTLTVLEGTNDAKMQGTYTRVDASPPAP